VGSEEAVEVRVKEFPPLTDFIQIMVGQSALREAEVRAYRRKLREMEERLSGQRSGFETAIRHLSRERETARHYRRQMDPLIQKLKSVEAELTAEREKVRKLEQELEARKLRDRAAEELLNLIRKLVEEKKIPEEVRIEVESLVGERGG